MDWGLPGSSVHGILQARVLEWVAMPSSRDSNLPNSGIKPASLMSPAFAGGFFTTRTTWEAQELSIFYHIFLITYLCVPYINFHFEYFNDLIALIIIIISVFLMLKLSELNQ